MGQREVLTVHPFPVLSWGGVLRFKLGQLTFTLVNA